MRESEGNQPMVHRRSCDEWDSYLTLSAPRGQARADNMGDWYKLPVCTRQSVSSQIVRGLQLNDWITAVRRPPAAGRSPF